MFKFAVCVKLSESRRGLEAVPVAILEPLGRPRGRVEIPYRPLEAPWALLWGSRSTKLDLRSSTHLIFDFWVFWGTLDESWRRLRGVLEMDLWES